VDDVALIGGGGGGPPFTRPGRCIVCDVSAGFDELDDKNAALAALKGWRAVIGLARSAMTDACRVVANMAATSSKW